MLVQLKQFEGPLDLLLTLIENQKLDISQISLAQITDEYIAIIQEKQSNIDNLVDFVEIAARLIVLKSALLLPYLVEQETEDDKSDLVDKLEQYKLYKQQSKCLMELFADESKKSIPTKKVGYLFVKQATYDERELVIKNLTLKLIEATFEKILKKRDANKPLTAILKRVFNIQEKIKEIIALLQKREQFLFKDITAKVQTKTEIIVYFLALLELSKTCRIYLQQKQIFDDIAILKHSYEHNFKP